MPARAAAQPFEIDLDVQYGQTVTLESGTLLLTFVSVDEDSRCPEDVDCIWQGQARTIFHVVTNGQDQGDVTLSMLAGVPAGGASAVGVGPYELRLDALAPYPRAAKSTPTEQYVATVHVKRT
jgi:hypothetical protein